MFLHANCETGRTILKSKLFLIIFTSLALLSSCTSQTVKPFPTATNDVSKLTWKSCHGNFQCSILKVPIDYKNKSLGDFDIAVIRYRSPNQRDPIGSLVVNPGGPGVSGVDYALNAEYIVSPDVLERYDIVGFDPRGIGASAPITCLNDAEQDEILAGDPKPDNEREFAQLLTDTQKFVNKCVAKTPNLKHYSTFDAAHDMELLRQGLGDSKLNYLGFSYGTYLGTLYAQQFPNKVGRFVLDGAINPSISINEQSLVQAVAFDQALANFIADCPKHKNCPLPQGATPQFFTDLFNKVSTQPLTSGSAQSTGGSRLVTEGLVVTGTAAAMYDNSSGWPMLRTAITQAKSGDGTAFAQLADQYNGRKSDGTYFDNQNDANVIIDCLDWVDNRSNEAIRAKAQKYSLSAPVFGPYIAYSGLTCNVLNASLNRTRVVTDQNTAQIQRTATPVLIVGTTHDPATPYVWAQALSRYIKGSHLVTLQGEGHTGYGRGSACIDTAVDSYLINREMPLKNLICSK